MTNISFKDAGDYAGTEDRDLLWHSLNQVEGGYQVVDEEDALDAIAWNSFRDAVKEHVRLHHRGGVHAIPGGGEYIETDEEFAYNGRIRVLAMRQDDVSRSPESVALHIDLTRARVSGSAEGKQPPSSAPRSTRSPCGTMRSGARLPGTRASPSSTARPTSTQSRDTSRASSVKRNTATKRRPATS